MIRKASIIARIESHLSKVKKFESADLTSDLYFNALAMECFQAVNATIELAEFTISERKLGYPANYKESFEMLQKAGVIDATAVTQLKQLVFYRNLVAHEYHVMTPKELMDMSRNLDTIQQFVLRIKKSLNLDEEAVIGGDQNVERKALLSFFRNDASTATLGELIEVFKRFKTNMPDADVKRCAIVVFLLQSETVLGDDIHRLEKLVELASYLAFTEMRLNEKMDESHDAIIDTIAKLESSGVLRREKGLVRIRPNWRQAATRSR
jgi:uncharacterized protein YutE (UPF0331/DUF86 family)